MQQQPVETMTRDQLMALFERYDFRDREGHKLTLCQDFVDLVQAAARKPDAS